MLNLRPLALCVLLSCPLSSAWAQVDADQAAARDFNAAAVLQNNGVYARAEARWTEFLKKYPKHEKRDAAFYSLGVCQLHTKKYAEAAKTLQSVISKYGKFPKLDSARFNLAMARLQLASQSQAPADYKTAAAAFAEVPARHPKSRHAHKAVYYQAESLYSSGERTAAVDAYRRMIKAHGDSPLVGNAYYALGTTLQELDEHEQAAAAFAECLAKKAVQQPELASEVELRLGISLFQMEKFAEAEKRLASAAKAENFPLADYALLQQGLCRMELGKPQEAAAVFQQLVSGHADSDLVPAAQLAAGKCWFLIEKFEEARQQLALAAKSDGPEAPEAIYWLGRTLVKQQKPQEALQLLEPAVGKHAASPFGPHLRLGRIDAIYEIAERRQETPKLYDAFAKQHAQHPLAPQAQYMAALAALGLEKYAEAQKHGEAFLAKAQFADSPLLPEVLYIAAEGALLAATSSQGGDLAKAEQLYRRLTAEFPEHPRAPRALIRIGWRLLNAGQHDQAAQHLAAALPKLKAPEEQAEAQLLIGRAHAAAGRGEQALKAYDASLKADPDWPRRDEVLVAAAESHRGADQLDEAAARLAQLRSQLPQSSLIPQATYLQGELAQLQDNAAEAAKLFDGVVKSHADSDFLAPALYGLAAALYAQQQHQQSLAPLTRLLSTENADPAIAARALYLRGLARQRLKQFAPAVKDFEAFLATKPAAPEALDASYAAALCQIEQQQWGPAVARLRALADSHPQYEHADKVLYELGHALLSSDSAADAATAFRRLGDKHPDSPLAAEGWFHVGRFHEQLAADAEQPPQRQQQLALAEQALSAGLSQAQDKPLREKLQYKLGDMQFRQEKYGPASATLLAQVNEDPQGELAGPARFLAGECLYRDEKFGDALPLYAQVAADKVDNYHAQALYRAGDCAAKLKSWAESQRHFAAVVQQFPKFPQISDARYGLGLALQNQNQLAPARQVYEQVTEETDAEPAAKARFMIGEISFSEKKYEEAVEHFLRVAVGYAYEEWQALAQFEAGRCFIELDKTPQAIKALQIVVNDHPDHPKAKDAAALIKKLQQ